MSKVNTNDWELKNVIIFKLMNGVFEKTKKNTYFIQSIYNYDKITSLFNNSDTMSFLEIILDYKKLLNNGYNESFLNQSLHTLLSMPFFLFLMTSLAAILTMNTLKRSDNIKYIIIGLLVSVLTFYFKDQFINI